MVTPLPSLLLTHSVVFIQNCLNSNAVWCTTRVLHTILGVCFIPVWTPLWVQRMTHHQLEHAAAMMLGRCWNKHQELDANIWREVVITNRIEQVFLLVAALPCKHSDVHVPVALPSTHTRTHTPRETWGGLPKNAGGTCSSGFSGTSSHDRAADVRRTGARHTNMPVPS